MSSEPRNAGVFRVVDGKAEDMNAKIRAAVEWDCDLEEIFHCDRCRAFQPFYTLFRDGSSLLCEICNDDK